MSSIFIRINNGEFKNTKSRNQGNRPWTPEELRAWREEDRRLNGVFRAALEEEYARKEWTQDIRDELFRQAWEHGHASGFHEVAGWYSELADLARISFNAGRVNQ